MSKTNDSESVEPIDENPQMKVYIKPGCPWCISALAWLEEEGYDFTKIDVINSTQALDEMVELSGQTLAPTLTYGSLLLADFGVPELEKFVEQHGIVPED
jgi:glutaredoxin 3